MDILSLIGALGGVGFILLGQHIEGGEAHTVVNAAAAVIVFGGTTGACLLETSPKIFKKALSSVRYVFMPKKVDYIEAIEKIVGWSNIVRKQGLLGLETVASKEEVEFDKRALFLLIDGATAKIIQETLEVEVDAKLELDTKAAKMFESLGGYAPTVGIIGAVLGLIHVMGNLQDPSKLGAGIASAFVATVYGIGFANLFCLPISKKLIYLISQDAKMATIVIEGVLGISQGENPKIIENKLKGFI